MPEVERVDIPPGRHYPNWRYMCPHCGTHWEMEEFCPDFRQVCKECILTILGQEDRRKNFSRPVEYTDTDGQVKVIPQGFKEVLDHIDTLPKNEDTINQIETFMVKLKEMVAWNEERKKVSHLPVCDECDGLSNGPWTPGACPKCLGLGRADGSSY